MNYTAILLWDGLTQPYNILALLFPLPLSSLCHILCLLSPTIKHQVNSAMCPIHIIKFPKATLPPAELAGDGILLECK